MSRVGETRVGEMGIGEKGVGEMGVGETGPNRKNSSHYATTMTSCHIKKQDYQLINFPPSFI